MIYHIQLMHICTAYPQQGQRGGIPCYVQKALSRSQSIVNLLRYPEANKTPARKHMVEQIRCHKSVGVVNSHFMVN